MSKLLRSLRNLGPAIIVAAVVCGPGTIFTASKVGASFGYDMVWLVVTVVLLMIGATALAARIGVGFDRTPCDEIAARLGRPLALLVGLAVFLICAGFQTSNNTAVVAAMEVFWERPADGAGAALSPGLVATTLLTFALIAIVLLAPRIYRPVERVMKVLIALMVVAFLANCVVARPSLVGAFGGLVPRLPPVEAGGAFAILGLVATTFSVAGAFYQAYLVRDRGWGTDDVEKGARDSVVGIFFLGGITLVIMLTAAATFFGREPAVQLTSPGEVALQLEPLFGSWAKLLFGTGIMAGALSSFLVNAMIGGRVAADGLGRGREAGSRAVRWGTVAALLVGWGGCLIGQFTAFDPVTLIVMAQATTVLGGPALALALLYLATRPDLHPKVPVWLIALGACGFLATLILSYRTVVNLIEKFAGG